MTAFVGDPAAFPIRTGGQAEPMCSPASKLQLTCPKAQSESTFGPFSFNFLAPILSHAPQGYLLPEFEWLQKVIALFDVSVAKRQLSPLSAASGKGGRKPYEAP